MTTKPQVLGARGGVIGGPRKEPPPNAVQEVAALAADGWSVVGIAEKMGVTQKTFDRWRNEYDDIREAFNRGRERERRSLHNRLYRTAIEGEGREAVLAAMFILKTRHGYREGDPVDSGGTRVNIFNLPGPMTREEFMKTVVGDERG